MFVLMSSRSNSKLGHLVSKLGHRAESAENFVIIILNFDQNVCLDLDQALKVLCCSGEHYRAIMALLFYILWQQRSAKVCMLCIWLHLKDDLKMQYSVDSMCDVIIIEITTVFLGRLNL